MLTWVFIIVTMILLINSDIIHVAMQQLLLQWLSVTALRHTLVPDNVCAYVWSIFKLLYVLARISSQWYVSIGNKCCRCVSPTQTLPSVGLAPTRQFRVSPLYWCRSAQSAAPTTASVRLQRVHSSVLRHAWFVSSTATMVWLCKVLHINMRIHRVCV